MTSLRYLTCLFLLTVCLTDLSKAGCRDQFTKNAWKKDLTDNLPDNISIQMDHQPKDVMICSIKNNPTAKITLEDCFDDTGDCEGESRDINVTFYHLMCLTDIAMSLTVKESKAIAADVCKVYEKVCEPFLEPPSTSAPKMTTSCTAATTASPATPTTAAAPPSSPETATSTSSTATTASSTTATAPPSSPKMTTPTSSTATATTASPTTATAPPSSPETTSTSSTATTASSTTATAPLSSPKMTTPTSSTATATTASPTTATAPPSSPETATSTSSTATTVSPATPTTESVTTKTATAPPSLSASELRAKNIEDCATNCATNETDIFKLQIVIAFLIFTNILGPLAVYMYMRRQRNKESFNGVNRNMLDTVQMTIQPKTVVQTEDSGEGAVLLKTPQCSIIINPPETTQTKKLYQNGLEY